MKRLISEDKASGKKTYLHTDQEGDRVVQEQNFDKIVEMNKFYNDGWQKGQMRGTQKHIQHVAEIPNVVYHHLLETLGDPKENPKAWKAWLNDHQNRAFRTGGGYL
jgi:hypothetical protein